MTSARDFRPAAPRSLRRLAGGALVPAVVAGGLLLAPPATAATVPAGPAAASVKPAATCSSTPFRSDPAHRIWFRIPSVVRTQAGSLVAFAERRDTMTSDAGNFDVVTARSTNNGCTWSPYKVIASDGGNRVSNPSAVVDRTTGKILVLSAVTVQQGGGGKGRGLYLQTSSDDGRSFTALLSRPIRPGGTYKGGLPGPGHALQLSVTHAGRIVVPLGYKTSAGAYGAYGIYSDDHGATWTTGYDQQDRTGHAQFIEGSVAELPSGELFITYRNKWEGAAVGSARQFAVSKDGGATLSGAFKRLPLNVVSVQGSALALKGTYSNQLLFSAPAVTDPNLRRQMSVFVSTTKGATWGKRYPIELQDTPGSYSDLVQLSDSTVGVLYETGLVTWKERIAFEAVSVPALTHPALVGSRVTFQRSATAKTTSQAAVTVTVKVPGAASPPGRVTLSYAGPKSGRTAVDLTYSNKGLRKLQLPKLPAGSYKLTLAYSGTVRIKAATVSAGTLKVVT